MLAMVSAAVPEFISVTGIAPLVVPTNWGVLNAKLGGVSVRARTGSVPVPLSGTVCGLPGALSLMVTVADLIPAAEGVKTTARLQLAPGARLPPAREQGAGSGAKAKSAVLGPLKAMLV